MKTGIFGGTFNPPHKGHIYIAYKALEAVGLDRVIFVPCGNPYHKEQNGIATPEQRLEMTRLAIEGEKRFEICDIETKSAEPSYTALTLERLKGLYPNDRLCLVVGGDSFVDIKKWYCPEQIFCSAEIIAIFRDGTENTAVERAAEEYRRLYNASVTVVEAKPPTVSSSDIRLSIKAGKMNEYVDDSVLKYIGENGIYGGSV